MIRFFSFILDLLEKKDQKVLGLEKKSVDFWKSLANPQKIKDNIVYFFPYQDQSIKRAILEIKARRNRKLLSTLTCICAENLVEDLFEWRTWHNFSPAIVIAIPSSNYSKGFNHSEDIGRAILGHNQFKGISFLKNVLQKTRSTPIQHSLSREKRLKNLKNSMTVKDPSKIAGCDILLVDDVTTTGATFEEATRALKKAGARKVFCVALAH